MRTIKPSVLYAWFVSGIGMAALVLVTLLQAPETLSRDPADLIVKSLILLVLTILSSISPLRNSVGATVTVGLAPLFGAFVILPPWAVMWVAALGTIDERLPGRQIPWSHFFFNRAMYTLMYGVPALLMQWVGPRPHSPAWYLALIPALAIMIVLNVIPLSVLLRLLRGVPVYASAKRMLTSAGATYIALPLVGYLIAVLLDRPGLDRLVVFLLYGPLLVYRASLQKQNRLDQWLRDSYIMQSRVVDKRDGQTFGHSQRVGELCEGVARLLHLSDEMCNTIRVGGILHDLGKIAIPDSILLKPGKLTPEEYEIIKTHPVEGAQILAEHPEQKEVADIVMHHHERWDGKGYPDGLQGEGIPIGSRIVNACDAFDTITQARVFRPTVRTPLEAITELRQLAGSWYDPAVIGALEKIVEAKYGVPIAHTAAVEAPPASYRDVLRIRPFRMLWTGQAVSYFGDMMNTTGLAIMLLVLTGSATMVSLGLLAKAAPTILFGLIAGPLVDRFNRQRLMVGADIARALLTMTIPFFAFNWLPGVFIAVFLVATASAFFNPAKQAILPNLVPSKLLVRANGLISSSEKTMELVGYSAAGLITLAVSWAPLFVIDSLTYLVSAVTLLGVHDSARKERRKELRLFRDIGEGTRFILGNPSLRAIMGLTTAAAVFIGMTFPVLVFLAYGQFRGGPSGYGFLEAGIGGGAILGAVLAPIAMTRFRAGSLILLGVAGMGLADALAGLTHNLWVAVAVLFLGGVANTIYYIPMISVTQREAPDWVRGRVMSSRFLVLQLGLLAGMAIAGPLTGHVGAPVVYTTAGALLVVAAVVGLAFSSLRGAALRADDSVQQLKPVPG
jgi:putative nucleotidyltransferase with HDIG domain